MKSAAMLRFSSKIPSFISCVILRVLFTPLLDSNFINFFQG